jgi:Kef-type K+ transport system membrane component KefB
MHELDIPTLLGALAMALGVARLLAYLVQLAGQPAVLGELTAGVILGSSGLGLLHPEQRVLQFLAEVGVVLLLFETGLETNLRKLIEVGGASAVVAVVGVVLPFALGYPLGLLLGFTQTAAVLAGATLTATSVGITARVLGDLKRLQDPESRIILGAAILDDVIGLVILTVVTGLVAGQAVEFWRVAAIVGIAFGFLAATLLLGQWLVPLLFRAGPRLGFAEREPLLGVVLAFGLAWLAERCGSAVILGAFAAGLLVAGTPNKLRIEQGVRHLGNFFVPVFFLAVGAAVDVRILNPFEPSNRGPLLAAGLLLVAAVVGKFLAGYAPVHFRGKKAVIGVGMIPRGEVGLIFAQLGLSTGVFDRPLFSALVVTVMATTFLAPPLLKVMFRPPPAPPASPAPFAAEKMTQPGKTL